ncbi:MULTISPECIES: helical backbone metal receptor [unclassified Streptomyces]|uniref:helical backbone metal receptor n=1 Tax=unclassified Streptomyces TaxID=2593676 RepID=UPI000DD69148|nr:MULTISPECIES: helical backbone metal receptor [unclassified Streptomyces]QZZ33029.1 cobalamin-binding protein [Streptomyces sp. ST1015]
MGTPVHLPRTPRRVVSLVPSLTEALAATGTLVGATDWCTHPAGLDVTRVRGTKNPDRAAITALAPDLVIANKEENRELDVRRLREAGVPVWVTVVETVPKAIRSLERLFTQVLRTGEPGWLGEARELWTGTVPPVTASVAVPVWRDPWMVVGGSTFTGDLLRRAGFANVFDSDARGRYPRVDVEEIRADVVLLPDEPYAFSEADGPEMFPDAAVRLVSGRLLTWYGPSLVEAREVFAGR